MCSDFCSLCVAIMSRVLEVREFGRSRMDAPRLSRFLGSSRFLNHCGERDELDELEGDDYTIPLVRVVLIDGWLVGMLGWDCGRL